MSNDIDVREHAVMLRGYMDAVGRAVTTDDVLYSLTVRELNQQNTPESILEVPVTEGAEVDRVYPEFMPIIQNELGLNGSDRLSSYLIDYLSWFIDMYGGTSVHRLSCKYPNQKNKKEYTFSAFHKFECSGKWSYMTIITISKNPGDATSTTPMLFDSQSRKWQICT